MPYKIGKHKLDISRETHKTLIQNGFSCASSIEFANENDIKVLQLARGQEIAVMAAILKIQKQFGRGPLLDQYINACAASDSIRMQNGK